MINKELLTTLTSKSEDISDFEALTPNHILLGSSKPNVEPSNYENGNYHKKWRAVQAYANFFWKRWLFEYLPTLSPRTKWTNKQQNFAVGDLVIVRNQNTSKSHWPLARIERVLKPEEFLKTSFYIECIAYYHYSLIL